MDNDSEMGHETGGGEGEGEVLTFYRFCEPNVGLLECKGIFTGHR